MHHRRSACAVLTVVVAIAHGVLTTPASAGQQQRRPRSRVAFARALPKLDGAALEATLEEVVHEPGGSSAPHRHPCPVIGYVIEGAVRMQVGGQPERIYRPGESFFESPTDVHLVSANASDRGRARFLAFFVCDHRTPLTVPVTEGARKEP
jgi:quercetin dioxygenase-like cupin family protein